MNKNTNFVQKLIPSVINLILIVFITYILAIAFSFNKWLYVQITFVVIALLYDVSIAVFNNNRCLGMIIMNTYWDKDYSLKERIIYSLLYTLSYATVIFYVFFPFDLLIVNLLFLQLPFVIFKKTTLHGYLSGNMSTVIYKKD